MKGTGAALAIDVLEPQERTSAVEQGMVAHPDLWLESDLSPVSSSKLWNASVLAAAMVIVGTGGRANPNCSE